MQVVILAGGLGTRLRPLTEAVPKPMVDVGGRPFLEYIIEHLANQGFSRLLLLVGYLGHRIEEHFQEGSKFGVSIQYSYERAPLGTAGGIRNAMDNLEETFLLLYGDSFLPIEYGKVEADFKASDCPGMLIVYSNEAEDTGVPNNVAIDVTGRVTRYCKGQTAPDLKYVDAGALGLSKSLFAPLPAGAAVSMENDLFPEWIRDRRLDSFVTTVRFFDIGTPERLLEFEAKRNQTPALT